MEIVPPTNFLQVGYYTTCLLRVRQSAIVYTVLLLSHAYAVCTRGRPAGSLKASGVDDLDCVVGDDVVVQLND